MRSTVIATFSYSTEVRNAIYKLVFTSDVASLSTLLVCKRLYYEARQLAFATAVFKLVLDSSDHDLSWHLPRRLGYLSDGQKDAITNVQLHYPSKYWHYTGTPVASYVPLDCRLHKGIFMQLRQQGIWPRNLSIFMPCISASLYTTLCPEDVEAFEEIDKDGVEHLFLLAQFMYDPFLSYVEVVQIQAALSTKIAITRLQDHDPSKWSCRREDVIGAEKWSHGLWLAGGGASIHVGGRYIIVGHEEHEEEVSLEICYTTCSPDYNGFAW